MSTLPAEIAASPRFLIVRLSAVGDVIQGMPLACALRDRFPESQIGWVVEARAATLLRGHSAIDELIELPRGWLKSARTVWQLRQRLRALRPDVVFEAQGLTKSAIVARLSGARRRIGFGAPWGRELSGWLNTETVDTTDVEHVIDRNLALLRPLDIAAPKVEFRVPLGARDRTAVERMIHECGVVDGFAIANSGAAWASKLWPNDRYATVAAWLGQHHGLPTLVTYGGAAERTAAEQIVAGAQGHARLAPPTSLTELAALAQRAKLFIGSDTGPLHLAAAVGTPCIGLYGPWPAERHGPYGPQHIAIQKMIFDGPTHRRRHASPKYMEAIQVDDVCEACVQILQRSDREAA